VRYALLGKCAVTGWVLEGELRCDDVDAVIEERRAKRQTTRYDLSLL